MTSNSADTSQDSMCPIRPSHLIHQMSRLAITQELQHLFLICRSVHELVKDEHGEDVDGVLGVLSADLPMVTGSTCCHKRDKISLAAQFPSSRFKTKQATTGRLPGRM